MNGLVDLLRASPANTVLRAYSLHRKLNRGLAPRLCPICGLTGTFQPFGFPPRLDARCPQCGSLERHRLFWLWFEDNRDVVRMPVLHFAPEKVLENRLRCTYSDYRTADYFAPANLRINIEQIDLPDASIGTVICNHVLEHVDDRQALAELHRVILPSGTLIVSVPIVEGWAETYEDPTILDPHLRRLHFGQEDHRRCYGRDFRERLADAGFEITEEVTAQGEAAIEYALLRGEKVFICSRGAWPKS